MPDRVVTAHIPASLVEDVDRLARRNDRPRGWIIKEALARYVELERKRHELTLEALADVDQGRVVDHDDITRWAATLPRGRRSRRG